MDRKGWDRSAANSSEQSPQMTQAVARCQRKAGLKGAKSTLHSSEPPEPQSPFLKDTANVAPILREEGRYSWNFPFHIKSRVLDFKL